MPGLNCGGNPLFCIPYDNAIFNFMNQDDTCLSAGKFCMHGNETGLFIFDTFRLVINSEFNTPVIQ